MGWYDDTYRKLFFDFHSHSTTIGLASNFDAEGWAERVAAVGAQAVSVFAKCGMGWSFYRRGQYRYVHPNLPDGLDMVEDQVNALHRRNIKALGYYHTFNSEPIASKHPDWIRKDRNNEPMGTEICMLSPLSEEWMLPQIKELVQLYELDALFFDGTYGHRPCYCEYCRRRFRKASGLEIPVSQSAPEWKPYVSWLMDAFKELRRDICDCIHQYRPEMVVSFNWVYTMRQPEIVPPGVGSLMADIFPDDQVFNASYQARHWISTGIPFDIMNTAFLRWWGDWGCKPAIAMKQEVATTLANGGLTWIGYQMDHSFDVEPAVMNELQEVMTFIKEREHLYSDNRPIRCIGVLNSTTSHDSTGKIWLDESGFQGLHRILLEGGFYHQFVDEVTLQDHLSDYQAVILTDQMYLSPELIQALKLWVEDGGILIVEGLTGTLSSGFKDNKELQFTDLLGVRYEGIHEESHAYVVALEPSIKKNTLDMPHLLEGEVLFVRPEPNVQVLARFYRPYLRGDGEYLLRRSPKGPNSGYPAITRRRLGSGTVVYLAGQFFRAYQLQQQWNLKNLFINLLNDLLPARVAKCSSSSLVEMVPMKQGDAYVIHLVNYGSLYPVGNRRNVASERIIPARDTVIELRTGRPPQAVTWEPFGLKLDHSYENGVTTIQVPEVEIHGALVVKT